MKLSLDWLSDFVDVPPLGALVERLTFAGIEVEGVHGVPAETEGVVVGEVLRRIISVVVLVARLDQCLTELMEPTIHII